MTFIKTMMALGMASLASLGQANSSFTLDVTADGSTRWYEYFSDAYAQLNRSPQGFYTIVANPDQPIGSGDNDIFPFGARWAQFGRLNFGSVSGTGVQVAPVTGLSLDVQRYIADDDMVLEFPYVSRVNSVAGTVTLFNGQVSTINLSANVSMVYDFTSLGGTALPYNGTFVINGNRFALNVDDSYPSGLGDPFRYRWDATGAVNNLAPIPEPAHWSLMVAGFAIVGAIAKRTRRSTQGL
jgi:hypothetical protein